LFKRGVNAIELMKLERAPRDKLNELVMARLRGSDPEAYLAPIKALEFKVLFGIITKKI
jgi:hypothetical protein